MCTDLFDTLESVYCLLNMAVHIRRGADRGIMVLHSDPTTERVSAATPGPSSITSEIRKLSS